MIYKETADSALAALGSLNKRLQKIYKYHHQDLLEVDAYINKIKKLLQEIKEIVPAGQKRLFEGD